jgi:purine-binding chemotaxis protein CheW
MSEAASRVSERAGELRRQFDRAFAEPVRLDTAAKEILLGIRVAGQPYAVRLAEAAGVYADKKITRVPGSGAALRGIAGFRGALLPVFDLHVLLGHPSSEAPRWLVIASAAPVALTFTGFEGQLRASREEILPQTARSGTASYARDLVRTQTFIGPILHLPTIVEAIETSGAGAPPREE